MRQPERWLARCALFCVPHVTTLAYSAPCYLLSSLATMFLMVVSFTSPAPDTPQPLPCVTPQAAAAAQKQATHNTPYTQGPPDFPETGYDTIKGAKGPGPRQQLQQEGTANQQPPQHLQCQPLQLPLHPSARQTVIVSATLSPSVLTRTAPWCPRPHYVTAGDWVGAVA